MSITVGSLTVGRPNKLTLILGPCVIESRDHALTSAEFLKKTCDTLPVQFIFKASYDKANRSSKSSFRGPGLDAGLKILEEIKNQFKVPVLTDVHSPEEATSAAQVCDVLQIPAFLCRQTDIILAAAATKSAVNVKKGQFMAPWDMKNVVDKIESQGNKNIILTDRGTSFGYNNLVCDMRAIPIMQRFGYPVCFDASHAVQLPGGRGDSSGGEREFIPVLAKAAIAAGADVMFIEAHANPQEAKSDKETVYPFQELPKLLQELVKLYEVMQAL